MSFTTLWTRLKAWFYSHYPIIRLPGGWGVFLVAKPKAPEPHRHVGPNCTAHCTQEEYDQACMKAVERLKAQDAKDNAYYQHQMDNAHNWTHTVTYDNKGRPWKVKR